MTLLQLITSLLLYVYVYVHTHVILYAICEQILFHSFETKYYFIQNSGFKSRLYLYCNIRFCMPLTLSTLATYTLWSICIMHVSIFMYIYTHHFLKYYFSKWCENFSQWSKRRSGWFSDPTPFILNYIYMYILNLNICVWNFEI